MKDEVLDRIPDLTSPVSVSVYDINPVHFLLIYCNAIKWVHKKHQVYEPKTEMVRDAHFCVFF